MPFSARDAIRHTKKATTSKRRRQWVAIANSALKGGASEGSAIRQANAAVRTAKTKARRTSKRRKQK